MLSKGLAEVGKSGERVARSVSRCASFEPFLVAVRGPLSSGFSSALRSIRPVADQALWAYMKFGPPFSQRRSSSRRWLAASMSRAET